MNEFWQLINWIIMWLLRIEIWLSGIGFWIFAIRCIFMNIGSRTYRLWKFYPAVSFLCFYFLGKNINYENIPIIVRLFIAIIGFIALFDASIDVCTHDYRTEEEKHLLFLYRTLSEKEKKEFDLTINEFLKKQANQPTTSVGC